MTREEAERLLAAFPVCEYSFGETGRIPFSDRVLTICREECGRYGTCWSCPPHAGEPGQLQRRVLGFTDYLLFSTVWPAELPENGLSAKRRHERLSADLLRELRRCDANLLLLSTGCTLCETCTCPSSPCRHPSEMQLSAESCGIVLMQLAAEEGLTWDYGVDSEVFFSLLLFDRQG